MTRLRDRVDVVIEAGLRGAAAGGFTWDVSEWDDPASTWGDVEPSWAPLDGWEVLAVRTSRGRRSPRNRYPAGTAEVQLGWRSPAGKWSFRPTSPVSVGMELRVSCRARDVNGESISDLIPIYRGTIRDVADGWIPDRMDPERQTFRLTLQLTERFQDVAAVNLPEQSLVGLGDLTHQRLERIAELAGVNLFYLRKCHDGEAEHSSSNFARNLLDEMQVTVEGEVGDLYVDREGFIAFRERVTSANAHPREDDVQLTWGNLGSAGTIAPTKFPTGQNLDDVVNRVTMARSGGTAYQAPDAGLEPTASQLQYGLRTHQRLDLTLRYDADVEVAADYWLAELDDRTQRVGPLAVDVNPNMPDAELLALLDIEVRDRHRIEWTDGAATLAGELHVQGVAHRISGQSWTIEVMLWAYAGNEMTPEPLRWGIGRWGVDVWG